MLPRVTYIIVRPTSAWLNRRHEYNAEAIEGKFRVKYVENIVKVSVDKGVASYFLRGISPSSSGTSFRSERFASPLLWSWSSASSLQCVLVCTECSFFRHRLVSYSDHATNDHNFKADIPFFGRKPNNSCFDFHVFRDGAACVHTVHQSIQKYISMRLKSLSRCWRHHVYSYCPVGGCFTRITHVGCYVHAKPPCQHAAFYNEHVLRTA